MNKKLSSLTNIIVFLQILGLAVSAYLIHHHYALESIEGGFQSFCSINTKFDCDVVNGSSYSMIFGVPIAVMGFCSYLVILFLSKLADKNMYSRRESLVVILFLSTISVLYSLFLLSVSIIDLKTSCIMCISLYIINTITFIVSILAWKAAEYPQTFFKELKIADRKKIIRNLATLLGLILLTHVLTYAALSEKIPFEEDTFLSNFRSQSQQNIDISGSPKLGVLENPKVQIIEFADFECPHCMLASKQMHRLLQLYSDKIQLIFKNYPLDQACNPNIKQAMHMYACKAAKGAICADKFGKFLPYFEKVFGNQKSINEENLKNWSKEIGLDSTAFESCVSSTETSRQVSLDIESADRAGVHATPTFFVNGKKVEGIIDEQRLKLIFKELGI